MNLDKETLEREVNEIQEQLNLFYQQKTEVALNVFSDILDKVKNVVDQLFAYKEDQKLFSLDEEKIVRFLTEAMSAIEEKDYILMADILQYDLVEYIQGLINDIE